MKSGIRYIFIAVKNIVRNMHFAPAKLGFVAPAASHLQKLNIDIFLLQ
jgi:hypothetical protein